MPSSAVQKTLREAARPETEDIRLGYLAQSIAFHLRLAQDASFRAFATRVGDRKLKPGHFAMLTLIGENPGLSQMTLSRASGRDVSSLTAVLDDLVRRKLVVRQRVPNNRRRYSLVLTAAGQDLQRKMEKLAREHDAAIDAVFDKKTRAEFLRMLRRITMALI